MSKQILAYLGAVVAFAAMYCLFTILFYREALTPQLIFQAFVTGCIWVFFIRLFRRITRPSGSTNGRRDQ